MSLQELAALDQQTGRRREDKWRRERSGAAAGSDGHGLTLVLEDGIVLEKVNKCSKLRAGENTSPDMPGY